MEATKGRNTNATKVLCLVIGDTMDINDLIDQFVEDLTFEALIIWADLLDVEVNYPPLDDIWPDWDNELRVEVGEAMAKVGRKENAKRR